MSVNPSEMSSIFHAEKGRREEKKKEKKTEKKKRLRTHSGGLGNRHVCFGKSWIIFCVTRFQISTKVFLHLNWENLNCSSKYLFQSTCSLLLIQVSFCFYGFSFHSNKNQEITNFLRKHYHFFMIRNTSRDSLEFGILNEMNSFSEITVIQEK